MSSNIIELFQKDFLGKGGQRECYSHPTDITKVLKILYRSSSKKDDVNQLEYLYYNILKKRGVSFNHIAQCYGYEMTSKGKALVFQRVLDYDNTPSISLKNAIIQKRINYETQETLLDELKHYLFSEKVLFIDYSLDNLFVQEYEKNRFKLIIIDGLGSKRLDWRFWYYAYSKVYIKLKIKKQWEKFIGEYYFERDLINGLALYTKEKLDLSTMKLLVKGKENECYFHPFDNKKVIKKSSKKKQLQTYEYFNYLNKKKIRSPILPRCYGYQKVNDGTRGMVFDIIFDDNGSISKSVETYIKDKTFTKAFLLEQFEILKQHILQDEILLTSNSISNIICQQVNEQEFRFMLVGGIGIKKIDGFKFWLFKNCKFFRKNKVLQALTALEESFNEKLSQI